MPTTRVWCKAWQHTELSRTSQTPGHVPETAARSNKKQAQTMWNGARRHLHVHKQVQPHATHTHIHIHDHEQPHKRFSQGLFVQRLCDGVEHAFGAGHSALCSEGPWSWSRPATTHRTVHEASGGYSSEVVEFQTYSAPWHQKTSHRVRGQVC